MAHVFDATLKEVIEAHPTDFVSVFELPTGVPTVALNVDLSTLSAATDVALAFGSPIMEIADLNFQSGPDPRLESRLLVYAAALHFHYAVPVRSLLVLLRPKADHSRLTGEYHFTAGERRVEFPYQVIRLWERPAEPFLTGGLGLLPLATLCQMPDAVPLEAALTEVVREIDRRLRTEANQEYGQRVMTAAFILAGMRVDRPKLSSIFAGVRLMHESTAYDAILEEGEARGLIQGRKEGRIEAEQNHLLRTGRRLLGVAPAADAEAAIRAERDVARLVRMIDAVFDAKSWDEVLAVR